MQICIFMDAIGKSSTVRALYNEIFYRMLLYSMLSAHTFGLFHEHQCDTNNLNHNYASLLICYVKIWPEEAEGFFQWRMISRGSRRNARIHARSER